MADRPARRGPAPAPTPTTSDTAAVAHLADDLLPALIARLEASTLGELEIRRGGWRVRLRRSATATTDGELPDGAGRHTARSRPVVEPGANPARTAPLAAVGPGLPPAVDRRPAARSPAVGYFSPLGSLSAGAVIRSGDVLGHVDVLGVRQEVVAPSDGVVGRYLAEAGEAVEYGQELVRLEAVGRHDDAATLTAEA